MEKILILGSSGLLGSKLTSGEYLKKYKIISQSLKSKTHINVDLDKYKEVKTMINQTNPKIIINLVALTNVDHCEKFPGEAYNINVNTIKNLVKAIETSTCRPYLIHISTDQVYDGKGNCKEKDISLSNYYSFSKYAGELFARQLKSIILRTNFFGKSKNFTRSSLTDWLYRELTNGNAINVFEDIWFNPLSMHNLCKIIEIVVEKKFEGIFNLGSHYGMTKATFAFHFAKALNLSNFILKPIKVSNVSHLNAYRPKNMMMNLTKFENKFKMNLPKLIDEINLVAQEYKDDQKKF